MKRLLDMAFIASLLCPFLTIVSLFMTNSGLLPTETVVPILFWLMPTIAIASIVISILSLKRFAREGEESGIVRKKAIAVLIQSVFFLGILIVFMGLLVTAIKHFN